MMEEGIKLITEYGVLVAIALMYIWDNHRYAKTQGQILAELSNSSKLQSASLESLNSSLATIKQSCDNTTAALSIISNTLSGMNSALDRHDKRSEYMNNDLREMVVLVKQRPCIAEMQK